MVLESGDVAGSIAARPADTVSRASAVDGSGIIEEGYKKFLEDLDDLLAVACNNGKLVAYHGKRMICVARTMQVIFNECNRQSVPLEEVMTETIQPQPDASLHVFDSLVDCAAGMDQFN